MVTLSGLCYLLFGLALGALAIFSFHIELATSKLKNRCPCGGRLSAINFKNKKGLTKRLDSCSNDDCPIHGAVDW